MTLRELSEETGVSYIALRVAVWEGRVKARKSGGTWLSTVEAVEQAIKEKKLRRP